MPKKWMTVQQAAEALGYSADYFRRTFCHKAHPLLTIRVQTRRILVLRLEVEALEDDQTKKPTCFSQ